MASATQLTSQARRWLAIWGAGFGFWLAVDAWRASKRDGTSVSELTRAVFGTNTEQGKAIFTQSVEIAARIFVRHIVR